MTTHWCLDDKADMEKDCPLCVDKFIELAKKYRAQGVEIEAENGKLRVSLLEAADRLDWVAEGLGDYAAKCKVREWVSQYRKIAYPALYDLK